MQVVAAPGPRTEQTGSTASNEPAAVSGCAAAKATDAEEEEAGKVGGQVGEDGPKPRTHQESLLAFHV